MFSSAANPYDEIIIKATDENLASEDWGLNIEVCDKVTGDGSTGARNAIAALQKRLSHRNPNVQIYALELANTLAQNCGKQLHVELASRNWTSALDRLVNDRSTAAPVKKKALGYIKAWAKEFEESGDSNLGLMGELYDQLRAKNMSFGDAEPVPEARVDDRQRQEEEELQRVLELSKQDRGGRFTAQPATSGGGSSSNNTNHTASRPQPQAQPVYSAPLPPAPEPEPAPLDLNTSTRVRAMYTFTSAEVGELNFERGDVIKVLDRGFQEWWRGACNGRIGIFPVTYVEPLAEPTSAELQREAQEEAHVFASLGLVDQLLQALKEIDPSRGDRLDDRPEVENMYQDSVKLQEQINALIKKYSDQKAELEHMNANFIRAMRQYEEMRQPAPMPGPQHVPGYPAYSPQPATQPPADLYNQQHPHYANQAPQGQAPQGQQAPQPYPPQVDPGYAQQPQAVHDPYRSQPPHQPTQFPHPHAAPPVHQSSGDSIAPGQTYYPHQDAHPGIQRIPTGAPEFPPQRSTTSTTEPGVAGMGAAASTDEHAAAWEAYYRQQAEAQQQQQHGQAPAYTAGSGPTPYGASPYAPQADGGVPYGSQHSLDGVTGGVGRMSVHGQ